MAVVNNKQIARNTLFLYIRMLLILAVSLYTSRVILKTLGVEDYGIYNLVAGFVTLFTFISNALVSAIQRFLNVALGENDLDRFADIFSMSITVMLLTSILILVLGETIGLWFVETQLNIPESRKTASIWVYQLSLLTFIINIIRSPYNAAIIAYERMSFYAYVSIVEVLLRLGLVFSLIIIPYDKLIAYTLLYLLVMVLVFLAYVFFCKKSFSGCDYHFKKDKSLFKEIVSFSGWSLLGQSAVVAAGQGDSFFVNRFFSVTSNAAMGVSAQLTGAIETFITNFQVAFNPQLIKTHTNEDKTEHRKLLFRASKFSFYLQLILSLPVLFNIDTILDIWLEEVPDYSNLFCTFILCSYLIAAMSVPLKTSIYAGGHIKRYEISRAIVFALGLLGSYIVLKRGNPPYFVAVVGVVVQLFLLSVRVHFAKCESGIKVMDFLGSVVVPCVLVATLSLIVPLATSCYSSSFWALFVVILIDVFYIGVIVWFVGLSKNERSTIYKIIQKKITKA